MGSRTCDIAGGCTMLSSRVSSALFVFFCFAIMTDEVLTTPDEVSELGEWLGAGRRGNLAANANGMLAAIQRKIQRKAQGRGPDPRATEEIKSAAAAAKKAQTEKESTAAAETAPADWRPKRPKRSTRTPWPASIDTSPTSGGYTVESDKWKTKVRQSNKGTDKATETGAQPLFGRAEAVKWNTASKLAFSCGIGNTYAAANEKRAAAAAAAKKATADAEEAKSKESRSSCKEGRSRCKEERSRCKEERSRCNEGRSRCSSKGSSSKEESNGRSSSKHSSSKEGNGRSSSKQSSSKQSRSSRSSGRSSSRESSSSESRSRSSKGQAGQRWRTKGEFGIRGRRTRGEEQHRRQERISSKGVKSADAKKTTGKKTTAKLMFNSIVLASSSFQLEIFADASGRRSREGS